MATLNDFKILNRKCLDCFNIASISLPPLSEKKDTLEDSEKMRLGFYYFILQNVLGISEYEQITEMICDTNFNSQFFGVKHEDGGVDAIFFDEEGCKIFVFNFYFSSKYNKDKQQSIDKSFKASKFFNAISCENTSSLQGHVKGLADRIIELNRSSTIWATYYYIVSNDNISINTRDTTITNFEEMYGIETISIGLDEIVNYMSSRPSPIDAHLLLEAESVMPYSEYELSSDKSYIVCLRLTDLLRITCNDKDLREGPELEDDSKLSVVDIDKSILYENVRGYILRSKYNNNILSSLQEEPEKFFYFNNGITIVAQDIRSFPVNGNKKWRLEIKNFQVLNGGQTLRTIHKFNQEKEENVVKLSRAKILVRIMKVVRDELKNRISEYTNSQNAISPIDLLSMRKEQIQLQDYLKNDNILYIRKAGETGEDSRNYEQAITLQQMGQILFAVAGYPGQVSNKKRDIFTKHYESLFHKDSLLSLETVGYVKAFTEIKRIYKAEYPKSFMEIKIFYILYLSTKIGNTDYKNLIDSFESYILSVKSEEESISRMLIKPVFMEQLKKKFKIE